MRTDIETDERDSKLPGVICPECGSVYKSIASHTSDAVGTVIQTITCYDCKYSWKELWYSTKWYYY
ncbi:MAG: hypothetical protein WB511_07525 [Nitrososphaeraceae archaeon]